MLIVCRLKNYKEKKLMLQNRKKLEGSRIIINKDISSFNDAALKAGTGSSRMVSKPEWSGLRKLSIYSL